MLFTTNTTLATCLNIQPRYATMLKLRIQAINDLEVILLVRMMDMKSPSLVLPLEGFFKWSNYSDRPSKISKVSLEPPDSNAPLLDNKGALESGGSRLIESGKFQTHCTQYKETIDWHGAGNTIQPLRTNKSTTFWSTDDRGRESSTESKTALVYCLPSDTMFPQSCVFRDISCYLRPTQSSISRPNNAMIEKFLNVIQSDKNLVYCLSE